MTLDVNQEFVQPNAKRSCGGIKFLLRYVKATDRFNIDSVHGSTMPCGKPQYHPFMLIYPMTLQFRFTIEIHDSPYMLKMKMRGFHFGSMFDLRQMCVGNSMNSVLAQTPWKKHAFLHVPWRT